MRDPTDTDRKTADLLTTLDDDATITRALHILRERLNHCGSLLNSPQRVREYLTLSIAALPHEEFGILWLDAQNRLIADDRLFRGTLTQTSVYPREVVKAALARNAAACVLYHNHPSGEPEPSRADELLTRTLKEALGLVDVRVLDHLIAAADRVVSFAERGLL
jgi:DNA repair protein RadC